LSDERGEAETAIYLVVTGYELTAGMQSSEHRSSGFLWKAWLARLFSQPDTVDRQGR